MPRERPAWAFSAGSFESLSCIRTLARVLTHLGAQVVRQNHVGDWGTQFGMLIQFIDEHPERTWQGEASMSALDALFRAARQEFNEDTRFADRSRARVVQLQSGDEATLATWRELVAESEAAFQAVYDRLGILLTPADADGESRYNAELPGIVTELESKGIAVDSGGALCTFTDGVVGQDGHPVPLIVRKKDGGFGYAAIDLATVRLNDLLDQAVERARREIADAVRTNHLALCDLTGRTLATGLGLLGIAAPLRMQSPPES